MQCVIGLVRYLAGLIELPDMPNMVVKLVRTHMDFGLLNDWTGLKNLLAACRFSLDDLSYILARSDPPLWLERWAIRPPTNLEFQIILHSREHRHWDLDRIDSSYFLSLCGVDDVDARVAAFNIDGWSMLHIAARRLLLESDDAIAES
jgi:hypothetical protein